MPCPIVYNAHWDSADIIANNLDFPFLVRGETADIARIQGELLGFGLNHHASVDDMVHSLGG
jgi:hypothetical protein